MAEEVTGILAGRLLIDGVDAWGRWGVYVVEQGWNELIALPPLKEPEETDWAEEDGVEVDLNAPLLDAREVDIEFAFRDGYVNYLAFVQFLSDGVYHEFDCAYIGRSYTLRMVGSQSLDYVKLVGKGSITFADDVPLDISDVSVDVETGRSDETGWQLDGVDLLSGWGVRVLAGSLAEVLEPSALKERLLWNQSDEAGQVYDSDTDEEEDNGTAWDRKEVTLNCLMRAGSQVALWAQWDALLAALVQSGERSLYVEELGKTFPCYYSECEVERFYPAEDEQAAWLEFGLTLVFTGAGAVNTDDVLLAAEDDCYVITEVGELLILIGTAIVEG